MDADWIDISRPIHVGTPVWPGDCAVGIEQCDDDGVLVSALTATCHLGAHLDAPLHVDRKGAAVDEIPLGRLIGPAEIVRLTEAAGAASVTHLPSGWTPNVPRVLLRTDSHPVDAAIGEGFVSLAVDLVYWLADRGVEMVGIDTPSVDPFSSVELTAHRALSDRGMTWIEGLDLSRAAPGRYLLIALPVALVGVEAAPVRAVVRSLPVGKPFVR